jgi:hypothetical protein
MGGLGEHIDFQLSTVYTLCTRTPLQEGHDVFGLSPKTALLPTMYSLSNNKTRC